VSRRVARRERLRPEAQLEFCGRAEGAGRTAVAAPTVLAVDGVVFPDEHTSGCFRSPSPEI
jgi:hypothetical protein